MIDAYTAATSNGLRAAIVLAESGLKHTIHKIDLERGDQSTPAFLAMNPAAQIPVIVDRDAPGGPLTLTESTAILVYVAEKSGRMLPSEAHARAHVFEAVANAMTDVYAPYNALFHLPDHGVEAPAEIVAGIDGMIRGAITRIDAKLANSEWLAGDFSIADIALYPTFTRLGSALKRSYPELTHLQRWAGAMAARPGVKLGFALEGRP
jgi:GST-like protein